MADKKYICNFCNYSTNYPCEWIKHTESDKHQRRGQKKTHHCEACDYETKSKWNMDIHIMSVHSTKESREKCKFYCKDCDQIFFCKLYLDKHMSGKKHKNFVKANELLAGLNNLI